MRILLIFFLLLTNLSQSQSFSSKIETNKNISKYKKVKIIDYYGKYKKSGWSKKIKIKGGKIDYISHFYKWKLLAKYKYLNDKKGHKIRLYYIDEGKQNDTIKYYYDYDVRGKQIEHEGKSDDELSNFNFQNLPQLINRKTSFDSIFGYKEERKYDSNGNILQTITHSKNDNKVKIDTIDFKYNEFSNLIELNRSSSPKEEYPIIIVGGPPHYENEKFRYVYNEDNFWIEKYWIVNNKENLIQKRKFRK